MTRYEVADGAALITLDHVENRNALGPALVNGLGDGLAAALADDAVRVVVLTNEGPAFCAGADLSRRVEPPGEAAIDAGAASAEAARVAFPDVLATMLDGPKPVIGRIAGHCMGGGVGLAAACDISVAADDVTIGFTEVRIGVAPAMISVVCLPKMRRADASELFLSGERITAARAVEVGLLNRAVPRGQLDEAVAEVVAKVVAGGPNALAAAKLLLSRVPHMDRAAAFEWTTELSAELFRSDEAAAGMHAFRTKTAAPWVP